MSPKSKNELLEVLRPRHLKVKQKMLDEFMAATGYHRKYACFVARAASRMVLNGLLDSNVNIFISQ